jgi:hypothetical protein
MISATKVEARTTSNVVTPNSLVWERSGINLPAYVSEVPSRFEDTLFPEDLSNDGNSRIDWVGDDENKCPGRCCGNTNGEIMNDASIDLLTVSSFFASI